MNQPSEKGGGINDNPHFVEIAIFSQKGSPAFAGLSFCVLRCPNPRPQNAKRFLSEADRLRSKLRSSKPSRGFDSRLSPPRRRKLHIACDDFLCFASKVISRSFRCSSFQNRTRCAGLWFWGMGRLPFCVEQIESPGGDSRPLPGPPHAGRNLAASDRGLEPLTQNAKRFLM